MIRRLVVVIGLCAVLTACSGSDDKPPSGSEHWNSDGAGSTEDDVPTSPAPDGSSVPVPAGPPMEPGQYTDSYAGHAFATPTGNIVCFIDTAKDQWGCMIANHTYAEPAGGETCAAQFGNGFMSVQGGTPAPLCRGGVLAEAEDGTGAILPYGNTLTVGSVTCLSEKRGVTCVDQRSGHSLFISKARYEIT